VPPELRSSLPAVTLAGQGQMSVWGFAVYRAALWVAPGFDEAAYSQSAFALELTYQRDFAGADIAVRSLQEMRRQGTMGTEEEARWEAQMRALFPNVKAGDRITGVHQPGRGAEFWHNGRLLGAVPEPRFAQRFFGIWLAPQTSEPQLRLALLAQARPLRPAVGAP